MRYKIYGQKVRELREEKGLSQRGFAKMVELPYMTLRRIEDKNFDNKERDEFGFCGCSSMVER